MAYTINPKDFNSTQEEVYTQAYMLCLDPEIYQGKVLMHISDLPEHVTLHPRASMFFALGQEHQSDHILAKK